VILRSDNGVPNAAEENALQLFPVSEFLVKVLLIRHPDDPAPLGTVGLMDGTDWDIRTVDNYQSAAETIADQLPDAVILPSPPSAAAQKDESFQSLLHLLEARRIASLVLADRNHHPLLNGVSHNGSGLIDVLKRDISLDELRGRLAMIDRYHHRFLHMERELQNMERLGKRLNQHFREVDQEMRLAARLQRDFLPRLSGPIGNLTLASIFRPASWVSGDIFDVFRIDEHHTAIYIADAVGHGVAASLLTIFIKRSIIYKRLEGDRYHILAPSETMSHLNDALAEQALPNCQFVTACYGIIDHRTLTFTYARGGHPYPLHITRGGELSEIKTTGGLLGLMTGEEFPDTSVQLHPGDKLLLYTDGMELCFQGSETQPLDTAAYLRVIQSMGGQPQATRLDTMDKMLDDETGSLNPRDDITIVGFEVGAEPLTSS